MMRRAEHREANKLYHDLAKRAIDAAGEDAESIYNAYKHNSQYYLEGFLCRIHDIVSKYYEEISQEILLKSVGFLDENGPSEDSNEVQDALKKARKMAAKPLFDLIESVSLETGRDTFANDEERSLVIALSSVRNIIVHNDAMPDNRFVERLASIKFDYTLRYGTRLEIDEKWLISGAQQCDNMIFSFDQHAVDTCGLPVRNRFGLFWLR